MHLWLMSLLGQSTLAHYPSVVSLGPLPGMGSDMPIVLVL